MTKNTVAFCDSCGEQLSLVRRDSMIDGKDVDNRYYRPCACQQKKYICTTCAMKEKPLLLGDCKLWDWVMLMDTWSKVRICSNTRTIAGVSDGNQFWTRCYDTPCRKLTPAEIKEIEK